MDGVIEGPRVLSLYEGFFAGGARILHTAVVRGLDATSGQRHHVLSLTNRVQREFTEQAITDDTSYRRLTRAGVRIQALDRSSEEPISVTQLHMIERAVARADVVLSLKEQPLAALSAVGTGGRPLLVALHRSDPEHSGAALSALVGLHADGALTAAICCSYATQRAYHAATGIPLSRLPVVENGVDLFKFQPSPERRVEARHRLGIPLDAPVVMLAARFDEMKDVPLFLDAAQRFLQTEPRAHLLLCGAGMEAAALGDLLRPFPAGQVHPLGIRRDMPDLYNATDLVALTSRYGEAAPLCLLEGMACGAVPVTTDVGDAARIVGDARLVTSREPQEVAEAWSAALAAGEEHRERIARHRQRLSEQRCFDGYARLINAAVPQPVRARPDAGGAASWRTPPR